MRPQTRHITLWIIIGLLIAQLACQTVMGRVDTPATESTMPPALPPVEQPAIPAVGQACLGTRHGITCLNDEGWFDYTRDNTDFPTNLISDLAYCPNGRWLVLHYRGVEVLQDGTWYAIPAAWEDTRNIIRIACAAEGFWVALDNGLRYYDGASWTAYPEREFTDTQVGTPNSIQDIAVAPDDTLWVARSRSIARYQAGEWTLFYEGHGFERRDTFEHLAIDSHGQPWVAGRQGLHVFDGQTWTLHPAPLGIRPGLLALTPDDQVWTGTLDRIHTYVNGEWGTYQGPTADWSDEFIRSLAVDASGRVWIGTDGGLHVVDGATWHSYRMDNAALIDNQIATLALSGAGPRLPVPTDKPPGSLSGALAWDDGLQGIPIAQVTVELCASRSIITRAPTSACAERAIRYTTTTDDAGRFHFAEVPVGRYALIAQIDEVWLNISRLDPMTISPDQETVAGVLKIPANDDTVIPTPPAIASEQACISTSEGITCINAQGWQHYTRQNSGLSSNWHYDLTYCPDGRWLALHRQGVSVARDGEWRTIAAGWEDLDTPRAIVCTEEGFWIAHASGVSHYDDRWLSYPAQTFMRSATDTTNSVRDIAVAPDGVVWVARPHSIARYERGEWTLFYEGPIFHNLTIDPRGHVWVSGYRELHVFDGLTWQRHDAPYMNTNVLISAPNGRIWAGTSQGVHVYSEGEWLTYQQETDALSNNWIKALAVDTAGRAWIGTRWGLNVLDRATWHSYWMDNADMLDHDILAIAVGGEGPPLPPPVSKPAGALVGTLVWDTGLPLADSLVEACVYRPSISLMETESEFLRQNKDTPCEDQPLAYTTTTDTEGRFAFDALPPGRYAVVVQGGEAWHYVTELRTTGSRVLVAPGEETDLGRLEISVAEE